MVALPAEFIELSGCYLYDSRYPAKSERLVSLLEKNARILASLENEWSDLGALRQINFSVRFNDYSEMDPQAVPVDEQVARFVELAKDEGCDCSIANTEFGDAIICVSKILRPNAENITSLQEKLTSFVNEYPRGYLDGWHYPPKKSVVFWPKSASNKQAVLARAEVLFGGELVCDPLSSGFAHSESKFGRVARDPASAISLFGRSSSKSSNLANGPGGTFRLIPSEFLRRAASRPPREPEPTVSAFSQWIYSLYSNDFGTDEDRIEGKEAEQEICNRRGEAVNCNDRNFLRERGSPWTLIHNGLHLKRNHSTCYFDLPHLRVRGVPLRASPDLIYSNRSTSEAIIVEIKYSRRAIPKNLWPNIWAQLWCYSQIETVAHAKKLIVVGEIWGEMFSRGYGRGRNRVDGQRLVCLRASVRRDPRAAPYDRFFRSLFQIYSGS